MGAPYYSDESVTLYHGDALAVLRTLPDASVDCCVTSPPYYGLRDYGEPGQYGLEETPAAYVETMRAVFAEVRRVLAADGTLWLNIGDSYSSSPPGNSEHAMRSSTLDSRRAAGVLRESVRTAAVDRTKFLPHKNLMGIPWRVAFALQDDGWILRNRIVWNKTNAMPEPVTDRLASRSEEVFLFSKSRRYYFDLDAIRDPVLHPGKTRSPGQFHANGGDGMSRGNTGLTNGAAHPLGRNPGDVWTIPTQPFPGAHFAVMPAELARRCIAAGSRPGDVVLDPFAGSCTTGLAAGKLGRKFAGVDLSAKSLDLALRTRLAQAPLIGGVS